ncbi:MAG: histone H1 [Candidatus Cyclobacteriaceae bacterium M3_2C_046]
METFNKIKELIEQTQKDAEAFYDKGNKAAGTRLRKAMLEVKNMAHDLRKEVTDKKNEA